MNYKELNDELRNIYNKMYECIAETHELDIVTVTSLFKLIYPGPHNAFLCRDERMWELIKEYEGNMKIDFHSLLTWVNSLKNIKSEDHRINVIKKRIKSDE